MPLNTGQQDAVNKFIQFMTDENEKFFVLHGSPGTGKTYVVSELIRMVQRTNNILRAIDPKKQYKVECRATTNKAAKVLKGELTKNTYDGVGTIYSLLGITVQEDFITGKTSLDFKRAFTFNQRAVVFIDEASYLDDVMLTKMAGLFPNAKIVYVLDPNQLRPVGVQHKFIMRMGYPEAELTEIMRNHGAIEDLVLALKKDVIDGVCRTKVANYHNGNDIIVTGDGQEFKNQVDTEFSRPDWKINDSVISAYTNKRVQEYGGYLRTLQGYPEDWQHGEIVISNVSNVFVAAEEEIVISSPLPVERWGLSCFQCISRDRSTIFIAKDGEERLRKLKELATEAKRTRSWHSYFQFKEEILDVRAPQACTIHKSQGSTYNKAFVDLRDINVCRDEDTFRRLLYVACSRPKTQLVVQV